MSHHIIGQQPCHDSGGGVFCPYFDGDGNEIGIERVDPIDVVQRMVRTAEEALQ